ncbi:MAG: 1,4-beta-xylanase [Bacteroidota bacterium]|nr:1,4-beta-xylanase [Bacteroidota bacterium]
MFVMKNIISLFVFSCSFLFVTAQTKIWSAEKANNWYKQQGWLVGSDFLPSTAINQLEMWQAETFDTATINRELGWAENLGMNTMRVFLHDLVWKNDAKGFKQRINTFLSIASKHHIKPLFVFFDDCWNEEPKYGKQPEPKVGVHNSGWMRSPARSIHNDSTQWNYLEDYVKDVLTTFKNDKRILLWDLYNEPANSDYGLTSLPLLEKIFQWAWAVRPSQPLTAGVWFETYPSVNKYQLDHSDVISFHNYGDTNSLKKAIDTLQKIGRPIVCTEYMARRNNSLFITHLPIFKRNNVAAINWGFVSGKSNTIFPWGSKEGSPEPKIWFHDIFRKDGTPFDENETDFIKQITKGKK